MFYGKNKKVTVAATSRYLIDVEDIDFDKFDNDVVDPDFVPKTVNLQGKKHHS